MSLFASRVLPLIFDIPFRGCRANGVGNPEGKPGGWLDFSGRWRALFIDRRLEQWDNDHPNDPPQLMGQDNPDGALVNWYPNVDYQSFVGKTTK